MMGYKGGLRLHTLKKEPFLNLMVCLQFLLFHLTDGSMLKQPVVCIVL